MLYDCRRYLDYKGDHAKVVPQWVEDGLVARTRAEDSAHFFHAPSLPFAYSSGKLQRGWFAQHQRLIEAVASQKKRAPVIVQGDFHASAFGRMSRFGDLTLALPVHIVTSGTLGTGDLAYPSSVRAVETGASQRSWRTLPNVARACLERVNDVLAATKGLVLKGLSIAPVQLRRATLYPAELRVRAVHLADWRCVGNGPAGAGQGNRVKICVTKG